MASQRVLRSSKLKDKEGTEPVGTKTKESQPKTAGLISPANVEDQNTETQAIKILPNGSKLPHISPSDLRLLRGKQDRLKVTNKAIEAELLSAPHLRPALAATLIFAHYEAGTAVCVDPNGLILTCSHCFGESEQESRKNKYKWLLFHTGQAVLVQCRVWDSRRDLALAQIIAVEDGGNEVIAPTRRPSFPCIQLADKAPTQKVGIVCIGQPGRDDLESTSARKTQYNLIEVSEGRLRGLVEGGDLQDNSDIGQQKHDAWTYWGHSGAPLIKSLDCTLIGLHSSWDDQTTMRHGISWVAIRDFLAESGVGRS